jgi:hypothetical protein
MPWIEDFEDNALSLQKSGSNSSEDTISITSKPEDVYAYDGTKNKYSGFVELPLGANIFENGSIEFFTLPRSGQEIYLEMNFKSNVEFTVGVYPITGSVVSGVPIVNLYSTADKSGELQWKKVYISLKEDVNNSEYIGAPFRIFINARTNASEIKPQIFIDNIKLVHF